MSASPGSVVIVALFSFAVFTAIIGGGALFYESSLAHQSFANSTSGMLDQVAGLVITLMFILGGLLFLAGAVRWTARAKE